MPRTILHAWWLAILAVGGMAATAVADEPESRAEKLRAQLAPHYTPPAEYAGKLGDYDGPLTEQPRPFEPTAAGWAKYRPQLLQHWRKELGGWPDLLEKPFLRRLESTPREGYTEHRVEAQIGPDNQFVGGYLLVPEGDGPFPAFVVPFYEPETSIGRGAAGQGTHDYGLQGVRRGMVTLSIGTPNSKTAGKDVREVLSKAGRDTGRQPLGILASTAANCHTALAQLPEVQPERIGIVGLSYGGKWTMFASCLHDKFACAVWSDPGIVFNEKNSNVNYWEPWYLGYEPGFERKPGVPSDANPRTGLYKKMVAEGKNLVSFEALMSPRPVLLSGGTEDPPPNWLALNHLVELNRLQGYEGRVAMTARPTHIPHAEALEIEMAFLEYWLKYGLD